uniref:Uncharacterized protein LOC102803861 n=1 Tax=Saccoglossus kowalevskii TaxID=10224 RepID=A0ABM0MLV1_SACKO|nr:PREDICTED: uncharacterized protein LOC102803861 [Saccoglossus kowalevskii]
MANNNVNSDYFPFDTRLLNESIYEVFRITKNVTAELVKLQDVIAGQIIDMHTIWYFFISVILVYLLTSFPRVLGARIKVYCILVANAAIELAITLNLEFPSDVYVLQRSIWLTRQCCWTMAVFCLAWDAINYDDNGDSQHKDAGHCVMEDASICKSIPGVFIPEEKISNVMKVSDKQRSQGTTMTHDRSQGDKNELMDVLINTVKELRKENTHLKEKMRLLEKRNSRHVPTSQPASGPQDLKAEGSSPAHARDFSPKR